MDALDSIFLPAKTPHPPHACQVKSAKNWYTGYISSAQKFYTSILLLVEEII